MELQVFVGNGKMSYLWFLQFTDLHFFYKVKDVSIRKWVSQVGHCTNSVAQVVQVQAIVHDHLLFAIILLSTFHLAAVKMLFQWNFLLMCIL